MTREEIEALLRALWPQTDRRPIWEWAADHVDFGNTTSFKGAYNVENVPWTREILRAFANPYVREITVVMPPQESGKTKAAEVCICWRAVNSPAPMAFNTVTNIKAEAWNDTRWQQMLIAVPAVRERFSENRHDAKKKRIIFRDGSFLLIQGAENSANRQGDTVEVQVNDEIHLWERPWLKEMNNRTLSYHKMRKILNISLGGEEESELHEKFIQGNQLEWSHHCPACGQPFQYIFRKEHPKCNIKFDTSKAFFHADGRLDRTEFDKTVYVHCPQPHCNHRMTWSEELLKKLNRTGVYVAMNPDANPEYVSLHANAFSIGARPWADILEPWVRLHAKGGVFASHVLREFITHPLAEFWKDRPMAVTKELRLGSYFRKDMLKPGSWDKEVLRFMAVDNQRGARGDNEHRWFVCRAFARDGSSRLVDCGRIDEWSQVREKQLELGVKEGSFKEPGPWVVVDMRWDPRKVQEICALYKWYCFSGHENEDFLHGPNSDFHGQRLLFSEPRMIDVGFGTAETGRTQAISYLWSSQRVQGVLAGVRKNWESWELPADLTDFCPQYADHLGSHRQKMEISPKTGKEHAVWYRVGDWPDHLYDCECMLTTLALMAGIIRTQ